MKATEHPQLGGVLEEARVNGEHPQVGGVSKSDSYRNSNEMASLLMDQMCCVPWGHHKLIIDKLMGQPQKAFFFVQQTLKHIAKH